jgi:hypothetical protein
MLLSLALATAGCERPIPADELGTGIFDSAELPGADEPYRNPELPLIPTVPAIPASPLELPGPLESL